MPYSPEIEALFDLIAQQFPDNTTGDITPADARTGLAGLITYLGNLTTNQIKGTPFRLPYVAIVAGKPTVPLGLIPSRQLIVGMEAVAVNGTDATSTAAGVKADPITFRLMAYSGGTLDALVDERATTITTVKARWVRTSGTDEEKMASFDELILEDHNYLKGDVVQYTFDDLVPVVTRLFEWRANSVGFQHPLPTGQDDDPIYKPFAPLVSSTSYNDSALRLLLSGLQANKLAVNTSTTANNTTEYATGQQAINATGPGGLAVLRGPQPELSITGNITVAGDGARMGTKSLSIGLFDNNTNAAGLNPQTATVSGFASEGRVVLISQSGATANFLIVRDMDLSGGAVFDIYGKGSQGRGVVDVIIFINCWGWKTLQHSNNALGSPLIQLQNRKDGTYDERPVHVIVRGGSYRNDVGAIFGGFGGPQTVLEYQEDAVFTPAPGHAVQEVYTGSALTTRYTDAQIVVDNRPTVAASPGSSTPELSYANEVVHTADAVLTTADLGKSHVLAGNTALTLTLPAVDGNDGRSIAVRVDAASTALHRVHSAAGIDTQADRLMWAQESAVMRVRSGTYNRTSGQTIPISIKIGGNGNGNSFMLPVSAGSLYNVPFDSIKSYKGPAGLVNNGAITFARGGQYLVGYHVNIGINNVGDYIEVLANLDGASTAQSINLNIGNGNILRAMQGMNVTTGQYLVMQTYTNAGGTIANPSDSYNQHAIPTMEIIEQPSW